MSDNDTAFLTLKEAIMVLRAEGILSRVTEIDAQGFKITLNPELPEIQIPERTAVDSIREQEADMFFLHNEGA